MTHSTWCCLRARASARPTADPGFAADTGVDLVEHQRRRCLREHHPQGQHRARELAAGRGLGERPGRLARVGREQEGDVVGAVVGRRRPRLDRDLERPPPAVASRAELLGHRGGQRPAAAPARRRERRRGAFARGARRPRRSASQRGGPRRRALRARRAAHAVSAAYADDVGERRPVLAHELAETRAARLHLGQPLGIVDDRLGGRRARRARLRPFRPAATRSRPASSANGARPASAAIASPIASARGAVERARARLASASRCASASASISSCAASGSSSSASGDLRGVDLVELVAQQVELARPGALVAAERAPAPRRSPRASRRAPGSSAWRGRRGCTARTGRAARAARRARAATGARAGRAGRRGVRPASASSATVASRPST